MTDELPLKTHVSYSEITDFRQCKLKHRIGWQDQWRAEKPSKALRLGTAWHDVMEHHYSGRHEGIPELIESFGFDGPKTGVIKGFGGDDDLRPQLEWMYAGHVEHYGMPEDEDFEVLAVEETWMVPLPNPRTHVTHLKVKLDLLIEGDYLAVLDHKSAGELANPKDLELDPQSALYVWAARQLEHPVKWAVRSQAKTKKLKRDMTLEERFRRDPIRLTPKMVNRAVEDVQDDLWLMAQGFDTRSPGKDCSWKCSYREACQASYRNPKHEVPMLTATGHTQNKEYRYQ